ncbi:MAG TPA: clostripain-related cysteine peptidase [Herpetosiphonaceae bacterium]
MPNPPRRLWQRALALITIFTLLAACADDSAAPTPVPKRTPLPSNAATPRPSRPEADPDDQTWLIMMYQDADDEILEEDIFYDFNEAELVGSTDRVRVVAQLDRYDGAFDGDGDWTSTKRFLVEQDNDLEKIHSKELADLGETNMADADTLIDFVKWAAATYPSDKYVLIMSDHGAGWPGGWNDPEPPTLGRHDIPLAQSFGDMLFLMEFTEALDQIMAETDIGQFELIGFDACLMSQLEVYTAIAPYANYSVASQEVEPSLGWAYAAILGRLTDSPEIDGAELSRAIVDSYIEQDQQIIDDEARAKYVERMYDYTDETTAEQIAEEESKQITLTAVDLRKIPDVVGSLNNLVTVLAGSEQKSVAAARRYAEAFETVFDSELPKPYIDLGSFLKLLKSKSDDPDVDAAADELRAVIDSSIVQEKHGEDKAGATGIAIHFPNSKLYKDPDAGAASYTQVANTFAQQSLWDDFLAFHYAKRPMPTLAQATEAPPPTAVPAEDVESPAAGGITVEPVTVSADTLSLDNPVTISSTVSGANVGFIYLFIGYVDPESGEIRVVDMDFLDADETKSVDGVFYPDWGAATNIEITFDWDTLLFALSDGSDSAVTLLNPDDYGATPEEALYTVEGTYTTAKGKKSRRAQLLMSNGELIQVLGFTGNSSEGAPREITPRRGDTFTVLEEWIRTDASGASEFYTKPGATFTFGDDNIIWQDAEAEPGEYIVGFIAEDLDGNLYSEYAAVTVQ